MRLLHTSDWHLGQTLFSFERSYEQQCFLDWLCGQLQALEVDALLVAGDVFDNANPSAQAQRQLYRFLAQAKSRLPNLDVVITAGNHDSPGRLEAPAPLLEQDSVHLIGHVPRDEHGAIDPAAMVVPLHGRDGAVAAWCLAVPFLRPGDVPRLECSDDRDPYLVGIATLYGQVLEQAEQRRSGTQAIVAMGHCHMSGGQTSEQSERPIVIGGVESLSAGIFPPAITYTALGHLHLAQRVAGREALRYSGSPLPLSFAEERYHHQVLCVDLMGAELRTVEPVAVPRPVALLRVPIKGAAPLAEVLAQLEAMELPDCPTEQQPYLEVRVSLEAPEPGLRNRIEAALGDKPVRLVKIDSRYPMRGAAPDTAAPEYDDLARLQPEQVFLRLCQQRLGTDPEPQLLRAFGELLLAPETEDTP